MERLRAAARGLQRAPRRALSSMRYRIDGPILVYQMGKVGSTAVYTALESQALPVPVEHVHLLTDFDAIERSVRNSYADPSTTLRQLEHGRRLRERIEQEPGTHWNIVTMVRDPVMRNVSAFFESLHELVPTARDGAVSMDDIGRAFLEDFQHDAPLVWFQKQLTPVFGIDPYATPFPHPDGFQILEGERARLLIIRYEDLAACFSVALHSFLGVNIRRLPSANRSGSKWYGPRFHEFVETFPMPRDYIDTMYSSEYARHFYTPAERARFEARVVSTG